MARTVTQVGTRAGDDAATLAGRSVLVTGGAGFIGSRLAATLVDGNEVRVLDDLSTGHREDVPAEATLVEGDVRDSGTLADAMSGVDVVFHQAAQVSVERSVERPADTHDRTATGTVRVLDAARDADARVVLASSAAVYGDPSTVPTPEDERTEPTNPYGVAKLAADQYARRYADLYGLDTVVLRYFNVYGPGQRPSEGGVVSTFAARALRDEPIPIEGDGEQTRDFVHVDDVVRANLLAARTDEVGRAYNVGTGERTSVRDLAETVRRVAGSEAPIRHVSARRGDVRHSCADVSRARDALGYRPSVDLERGSESVLAAIESIH